MLWLIALVTILQCIGDNSGQRVAPGVPPQNYQQQPQVHPGGYQQPHAQQQQVPVQPQYQQQAPPQQQQQQAYQQQQQQQQFQQPPVPQQQVPVQQAQHHQAPVRPAGQNPGILNAQNIAQEKDHIAEHMEVPMDTSKMSEQELQFHYFKMHDADNNNKLDGCELIKSLIHWHVEQGHKTHQDTSQQGASPDKIFADDELINLIDPILSMDDRNKDGYIDYPEFVQAQQKSQHQQQQQQKN